MEDNDHPQELDGLSTWDEIRKLADELELKLNLAQTSARDRWQALQPRLAALELVLKRSGRRAWKSLAKQLVAMLDVGIRSAS
jgi:hypothetical protein